MSYGGSAQSPAPRTFAPSREDVLSTLGFFFGDPAVPEKLKDYSEHHAMTCAHRTAGLARPRAPDSLTAGLARPRAPDSRPRAPSRALAR
jgi:hypothetical protein